MRAVKAVACWEVAVLAGLCACDPAPVEPACQFGSLSPAANGCTAFPDEGFEAVCAVDCLGGVYAEDHGDSVLVVPENRYYGVLFVPRLGQQFNGLPAVSAFVSRDNVHNPVRCCP